MNEFETMCRIITKFPPKNEEGEDQYEIKEINQGHVIYFATYDSYCWACLYFDSEGKFIGFSLDEEE